MSEALGSVLLQDAKEGAETCRQGPCWGKGRDAPADCHAVPRHPSRLPLEVTGGPGRGSEQNICPGNWVLVAEGDSKNVAEPGKGQQRHFQ